MATTETTPSYRVLARKYRPQTLNELVGQDVLVKTLTHGISANRLPHAFILHGIRGVGKTTTARIIAKALNCVGSDGKSPPTPQPCGVCFSCLAIVEDRHLDVVEMDAASRTGVDDIREVIESSRYKAVNGRYKIYIIDEVHMLSRNAFNALLKTLEEPPPHVKFIFATTELKKIPDTVLSRCMRFDLNRVSPTILLDHFKSITAQENITAEEEALTLIVRAADGSVRDGLSLLEQAISLSPDNITTLSVREMLGLVDRGILFTLLNLLLIGQAETALNQVRFLFSQGGDPLVIFQDLLDVVYWITCLKATPKLQHDITYPESDRTQGLKISNTISLPSLMRAWQVLSKGYEEVNRSPLPFQAAEMALLRLCYLSELPQAQDLLAALHNLPLPSASLRQGQPSVLPPPEPSFSTPLKLGDSSVVPISEPSTSSHNSSNDLSFSTFQDLLTFLSVAKEPLLYSHLVQDVHLVEYKPFYICLRLTDQAPKTFPETLTKSLNTLTGKSWTITVSTQGGEKTITDQKKEYIQLLEETSKNHPVVTGLLEEFPQSTLSFKKE